MKIDQILGGIVSIFVLFILVIGSKAQANTVNGTDLENDIGYVESNLSPENMQSSSLVQYTNPYNHQVELNNYSIELICNNNYDDNMQVDVLFAHSLNGKKEKQIVLDKNEDAYIFVNAQYIGDYPKEEIICEYTINLNVAA